MKGKIFGNGGKGVRKGEEEEDKRKRRGVCYIFSC